MKNLQNITLCIIDCKNYENAAKSIIHCSKFSNINFAKSIYFSDIKHYKLKDHNIDFIKIDKIKSAREYDNFIIKNFYKYIDTDFVLIVQHDGLIYKSENWSDNFLKFDYIGACWPTAPKKQNKVGNGGFSLRSKKFMHEASKVLNTNYCNEAEDVYLCETLYDHMKNNNFKYATVDIASNFSSELEWSKTNYDSFGFHLAACNPIEIHKQYRDKIYENIHKNW